MADAVIECAGLTKVYRDFWLRQRVTALDSLDLRVESNQIFGLLGPNGSGKSTTIKLLLGLLNPTKGRVAVLGKLPSDVAVKARIGYLPEESYLHRFLTPRETLDYFGRLFGLSRDERKRRVDMLLDMVGLAGAQRRAVGEFSKGMQRRLGLATALINDPDLLILDEPTSGLDPLGSRQIKDLILNLRARGKTVLLSSHLLADVEDLCDRVTVLYGGKKRAEGTVGELLRVSGSLLIETDALSESALAKVKQIIEGEHKTVHRLEAPRKKLETLFLEIVAKAQAEGVATSGAKSGGQIAGFLAADALPAESDADSRGRAALQELLKSDTPPAPESKPAPVEPPKQDLGALVQPTPAPQAAKPAEQKPQPDRKLLDDLLGGGKS